MFQWHSNKARSVRVESRDAVAFGGCKRMACLIDREVDLERIKKI